MPINVGSNIASLRAQRLVSKTSSELSTVYERLSSGMRINKASDDAAGLAIAEALKSDRRVFSQGIRNFNDGLSLLTIADSAVESLSNIVMRLKELAEQSSNGTYSTVQRSALDKEAQALSKEYLRVVQTTKFNGIGLLDGNLGSGLRLQGGYGASGGISSGIGGAIGTGTFTAASISTLTATSDVQTADLNGDGILDIVTAGYLNGTINVLLGTGGGSFQAGVSYLAGTFESGVSLGDFNNDGSLDIVGVAIGGTVTLLTGRGNGSFAAPTTLMTVSNLTAVNVADFNGDGNLDFAFTDSTASRVSVSLGNGDGTFRTRITTSTVSTPTDLEVGDFNGDGIVDLVTGSYAGSQLSLLIGRGDGTFQSSTLSVGTTPQGVATGDFNGDGKMDIAAASYPNNTVSILLGNGNGTFQSSGSYQSNVSQTWALETGDFNGDGFLDLTTTGYGSSTISVMFGNGNGTFGAGVAYDAQGSRTINTADLNGDGVLDIISGAQFANSISLFFGRTKDGSAPLLAFDLTTKASSLQALSVFDQKLKQLSAQRGTIGAFQSRVHIGISNLESAVDNYAAAESRIRDADIAQEAANLVRLQILQKASTAILAQANLQPQLALTLLKGGGS